MAKQMITSGSACTFVDQVSEYNSVLKMDKSPHTIASYSTSLDQFFSFINLSSFDDIASVSTTDLRKYQAHLKSLGLQASTINVKIQSIKVFYNWLAENGHIEKSPLGALRKLKEIKKNLAFLSEDEIIAMFNACKNLEEKAILSALIYLGLRRSELVNLKIVDIDGNQVNIIGKGSKGRKLFLPESALSVINEYVAGHNSEYVFPSSRGGNYSTEAIRLKINRIAKNAGIDESRIEQITPHVMRRTFATNLVESGVNMGVIQRTMGHSDIETTMRYAKIRDTAVQNVMMNQRNFMDG